MADTSSSEQPGWTGRGGVADAAWNTVQLGDIILPGVCTVTGFDAGQDVDVKKQKGSDGATLEDNGKDPAEGKIEAQINEALWPAWQKIIAKIHPRMPGAARAPREIIHPKPNILGIRDIYVRKISIQGPTARGGMKITIDCIEWCPKPKSVKKAAGKPDTAAQQSIGAGEYSEDPNELARKMMLVNTGLDPSAFGPMELNTFPDTV